MIFFSLLFAWLFLRKISDYICSPAVRRLNIQINFPVDFVSSKWKLWCWSCWIALWFITIERILFFFCSLSIWIVQNHSPPTIIFTSFTHSLRHIISHKYHTRTHDWKSNFFLYAFNLIWFELSLIIIISIARWIVHTSIYLLDFITLHSILSITNIYINRQFWRKKRKKYYIRWFIRSFSKYE